MNSAPRRGQRLWATSASLAALCVALGGGCNDDDDDDDAAHTPSKAGSAGTGGASASATGGGGGLGGAVGGEAGGAGTGGGGPPCDCGDDPTFLHVPLECAREHGLLTVFEDDLREYQNGTRQLGLPYYVLLGSCEDGHHTLEYSEAGENSGISTYDAQGDLVYEGSGPYGVAYDVCGDETDSGLGNFGIGAENPARSCSYCLVDADRGGSGGAGSGDDDPAYDTPPCEFVGSD